jgi:16S rRNA (adenine1518-N6/adenine1519-N6)-dimethyltransferase
MPRRQTLTFLRNLFEERGLHPKNKLGQNFLIDLNLLEVLVGGAELTAADLAVEIGTGTGSLTARLAQVAGAALSVEIDPAFFALAQETLGTRDNVRLIQADILKNKNRLNPDVLQTLEELRQERGCTRLKLVANLPYAVATPVIANFLISELAFERMVVTVQWEIAQRLLASPSSKEYGALSVLMQSLAEVELLRQLPPAVFWPRPKVASAIVRIRPDPARRSAVGDVDRFRRFLRDLYTHRRKNLRGALAALPGRLDKDVIDRRLAELGLDGTIRAETLDVAQHLRLCSVFGQAVA